MSSVMERIDEQKYAGLLAQTLPHVIHSEQDSERWITALEALDSRGDSNLEEKWLAELLTLLIEDFEEKAYSLPAASPVDTVRHLMEENGLRQADMLDVFGTASIASEVLNGKRSLAKSHIERLSRKFKVSPAVFFDQSLIAE